MSLGKSPNSSTPVFEALGNGVVKAHDRNVSSPFGIWLVPRAKVPVINQSRNQTVEAGFPGPCLAHSVELLAGRDSSMWQAAGSHGRHPAQRLLARQHKPRQSPDGILPGSLPR